jgi:FkbM family methyltransferase
VSVAKRLILRLAAWLARLLPMALKRGLYRHPFVARAIRKTLNTAAPQGLSAVKVAAGALAGFHLHLDLKTEKDYWLGTYEPDLQIAARDFFRSGEVVYDVGANIGYISLMAARIVGENGRVYAFEALPANLERLKEHIALNHLEDRITAIHAAVTERVGEAIFLAHASGAMGKAEGSAGRETTYSQHLRVPSVTLDHFVFKQGHPPPHTVKMDIEGGEGLALAGMQHLLTESKPTLLIELHGEQAARQVWKQLAAHAYRLHSMRKPYTHVDNVERLDWKAYVIAIPQENQPPP